MFRSRLRGLLSLLAVLVLVVVVQLVISSFWTSSSNRRQQGGSNESGAHTRTNDGGDTLLSSSQMTQLLQFIPNYNQSEKHPPRAAVLMVSTVDVFRLAPFVIEARKDPLNVECDVSLIIAGDVRNETLEQFGINPFYSGYASSHDVDLRPILGTKMADSGLLERQLGLTRLFHKIFERMRPHILLLNDGSRARDRDADEAVVAAATAAKHLNDIIISHIATGSTTPIPASTKSCQGERTAGGTFVNRRLLSAMASIHFVESVNISAPSLYLDAVSCSSEIYAIGSTVVDALSILHQRHNSLLSEETALQKLLSRRNSSAAPSDRGRKIVLLVGSDSLSGETLNSVSSNILLSISGKVPFDLFVLPSQKETQLDSQNGHITILEPVLSNSLLPIVLHQADVVISDLPMVVEEALATRVPALLLLRAFSASAEDVSSTLPNQFTNLETVFSALRAILQQKYQPLITDDLTGGDSSPRILQIIVGRNAKSSSPQTDHVQQSFLGTDHQNFLLPHTFIPVAFNSSGVLRNSLSVDMPPLKDRVSKAIADATVKPEISFEKSMSLPSRYPNTLTPAEATVTAIVSFYNRINTVRRMVSALMSQTHPPAEIWLYSFASPHRSKMIAEFKTVQAEFNRKSSVLRILTASGDMQLGYHGRFQLAIQATTKYVAIFDDDCIPGSRYLDINLHIINTETYRGILGIKGHSSPPFHKTVHGRMAQSSNINEVDVVGGTWFMETDHVRLMFRDKPFSWRTGEDCTLCAHARKYANIGCFTISSDPKDPTTWGYSSDYLDVSLSGDTTDFVKGMSTERERLQGTIYIRGDNRQYSVLNFGSKASSSVLVFGFTVQEAQHLQTLVQQAKDLYSKRTGSSIKYLYVAVGRGSDTSSLNANQLLKLDIGRDFSRNERAIDITSDVLFHLNMMLRAQMPAVMLVDGSNGDPATLGAVTTANYRGVCTVVLFDSEKMSTSEAGGAAMSLHKTAIRKNMAAMRALADVTVFYSTKGEGLNNVILNQLLQALHECLT